MRATDIAKEAKYVRLANGDLSVEGAAIIYKNFSGNPTNVNPSGGKRTFALVVPQSVADDLVAEGWNVKQKAPAEEGDEPMFYTEIVVNMNSQYPPKLHLLTKSGERESIIDLDENTINELDRNALTDIVMTIRPYQHGRYNAAGSTVKGYLQSMFATQHKTVEYCGMYEKYYNN